MTARVKTSAMGGGAHTAGIYADMSVDGPIIGTLVAVVDRAKNLPNRKTIGKQDPYCAARLGKEAKKTATDIRGGQTPKWDQELRFTVHDSSDYYQLKISIFTDDKKTDLVGESWVDLKSIILPGGGQRDLWQTLTCRGKYAGEIRMEITFYDSRAKPEKPAMQSKQLSTSELEAAPAKQRPTKRRPLPSDPITGQAPTPPASAPPAINPVPDHHQQQQQHQYQYHQQTVPRANLARGSNQPSQPTEYMTAAPPQMASRHHSADPYPPSAPSSYPGQYSGGIPGQTQGPRDPYEASRRYAERDHLSRVPAISHEQQELYETLPPQPPAHRSSHGSQEVSPRSSFEGSPQKPSPMRQDVLRSEAHRSSVPAAYPGRSQYRSYESAPPDNYQESPEPASIPYGQTTPSRQYQYDAGQQSHAHPRSMQPTVEDAPETPTGYISDSSYLQKSQSSHHYDETAGLPRDADPVPPRNGASFRSAYQNPSFEDDPYLPTAGREFSQSPGQLVHTRQGHRDAYDQPRYASEPLPSHEGDNFELPDVPQSLVPATDPRLSRDISNQISEERLRDAGGRYHVGNNKLVAYSRGYDRDERSYQYGGGSGPNGGQNYLAQSRHSAASYPNEQPPVPVPVPSQYRNVSPNPHGDERHAIRRKSVSPAPVVTMDDRSPSGMPFGPDSFDSYNPAILSRETAPGESYMDPDAKIVDHAGREVDPSDHLPMSAWAPEPEHSRGPTKPSPEPRSRPTPGGAQPMPPTGRRPLRVAGRHSMSTVPAGYQQHSAEPHAAQGRQRLQKKNRHSAAPESMSLNPLGPIAGDNLQERPSSYAPGREHPRTGAWDYPNENHQPLHGSAPPVPAKIPVYMSGANGGGPDQAFVDEMSRIDIGAGRSRRRGGY